MNTVGRYERLELIGKGGMGRVFLGKDTTSGLNVAIKVLPTDAIDDDPGLLERLKRESEALRILNHPNIVKMLDVVEDTDNFSIILEYVEGGSLADLLRKQPQLPLQTILKIALELADALARAHHLKIIHRDIKPANILLANDGTPRLTDFGLARMEKHQNVTQTGAMVGSVAYLSPEAIRGETYDSRTDIWSFGVVVYEMLAGKHPFDADSSSATLANILLQPVPDLAQFRGDLPPRLVNLVLQMLEKEPNERIPSARRVGAELEELVKDLDSAMLSPGIRSNLPTARFATPLPDEVVVTHTPAPRDAKTTLIAPTNRTTLIARAKQGRGVLPIFVALLIGLGILFGIVIMRNQDKPSKQPAIATIEPVAPGEMMVLIAHLEKFGDERPQVDRFIRDDLIEVIEKGAPITGIRIREYPQVVKSEAEAMQVAQANQAPILVWGNYTDDFIEIEIVVNYFGQADLPIDLLWDTGNVRLRLQDERSQSIAPQILTAATIWHAYDGDAYDAATTMVAFNDLGDLPRAEITGVTVGAHVYRHYENLYDDPAKAVESLDSALQINPRNPIVFHLRGAALDRVGRYSEAVQDINTAILISDNKWAIPYINIANVEGSRQNFPVAIEEMGHAIELEPNDWLPYAMRGSFYFLNRQYPEAAADFDASIARNPKANFPYALAINIAIREGRIDDVTSLLDEVLQKFPDPTLGNRVILTAGNQPEYGGFYGLLLSAFANLALHQYDATIRDVDAALEFGDFAELYLFKGVAYCVIGDLEASENAYTEGIERDPDFTVLYLLRADIRRRNNDLAGALQDFQSAQQTTYWPNFAELASNPANMNLGCENFFPTE
ncbi:MAG: protein kinase [Chloroflexi bacterium]|nr:protein kinase [Chloroflexota bacterium]